MTDAPLAPETRAAALRRRHRRVLGWSLAGAAALHLAAFAFFPNVMPPLWDTAAPRMEAVGIPDFDPRSIDVIFGPPAIRLADGTVRQEPPERILEAREVNVRGIALDDGCEWVREEGIGPVSGAVRLRLGASGRVLQAALHETFGHACVDDLLVAVAGMLLYHWLPDEEAPAPVDLVQPITAATTSVTGVD